jgi:hypothetical protein
VLEFNFLYKNVNDVNSYDRLRYFKGDYEAINEVLANVDWELLLATGSIDDLWIYYTLNTFFHFCLGLYISPNNFGVFFCLKGN